MASNERKCVRTTYPRSRRRRLSVEHVGRDSVQVVVDGLGQREAGPPRRRRGLRVGSGVGHLAPPRGLRVALVRLRRSRSRSRSRIQLGRARVDDTVVGAGASPPPLHARRDATSIMHYYPFVSSISSKPTHRCGLWIG
jgi:hypothetical protein